MPIEIPQKYRAVYESICTSFRELEQSLHWEFQKLPEVATIQEIADRLEKRLFTLVFVGGFNTGKSSLINVLFQREVYKREQEKTEEEKALKILCKENAIAETSKIHILKWGEKARQNLIEEFILEEWVTNSRLRDLHMEIVDTPGTDSTNKIHDEITKSFIPRADMVFFIFSVDQAFKETERDFLKLIYNSWKREIVFILNKIDTKRDLEGNIDQSALDRVIQNIREKSQEFLNHEFAIYPVSSQMVKESLHKKVPEILEKSNIHSLENYISHQLQEILHHIKLKSAIQTSFAVCEKAENTLNEELAKLDGFYTALGKTREFVSNYWNLSNQNHTNALFTDRHSTFRRFDELLENLEQRIDQTFNLPQIGMALFKGGVDQLNKSFRKELKSFTESFKISLRDDLSSLVENFSREFALLLREQQLGQTLKNSEKTLSAMNSQLIEQVTVLVQECGNEDLDAMLEQLVKRMMISLGGWLVGVLAAMGSLMSLFTNPLQALSGGLIGGAVVAGSMFWFNLKKRQLKQKFIDEIHSLKGEFRGNIKTKLKSDIVDNYLYSYSRDCEEKRESLGKKKGEIQELRRKFESYQKEMEEISSQE